MGQLVDGAWTKDRSQMDAQGRFIRRPSSFRDWIRADGSTRYRPEPGRYHLYLSYACPWAHRTLIMRKLAGLEDAISLSVAHPFMGPNGWEFAEGPGCVPDPINGARYLSEVYQAADPDYTGRVTVPVLWDKQHGTIVSNESREIVRMFDVEFRDVATREVAMAPVELRDRIDEVIDQIYQPINNGVYRAGFAGSQEAHEEAVRELFAALDHWEQVLGRQRYLCGDVLTEADICLFPTLLRFDLVYHTHFKCNVRRLVDYPNLWGFTREIYQLPGVADTCDFEHTKRHYYTSHESIHPRRYIPLGPFLDFDEPHDRDWL